MLIVDILLCFILLGLIGGGAKDGFIHTLGRIIGAIIGFVAARAWSLSLVKYLGIFMPAGWAHLISFLIIFIAITRVCGWLLKLADNAFGLLTFLPFLKSINRLLGAILGFIEGFIVLGGASYIILTLKLEPHLVDWLTSSPVDIWLVNSFKAALGILL